MARSANNQSIFAGIRLGRFLFWLVIGLFFMVGTLFAWRRTEEFLIKDDDFRIVEPDDLGVRSSKLDHRGNPLRVGFSDQAHLSRRTSAAAYIWSRYKNAANSF